ncbi:MAG: hypothetical protein LR015_06120 [Verrucomicrobia bacterium]|nr:hypothetical protein [Verrucomicrobiota bacterium]
MPLVPLPLRYLALTSVSENHRLESATVAQLKDSVLDVGQNVPRQLLSDWQETLRSLWLRGFSVDSLSPAERAHFASLSEVFAVEEQHLNPRQRLAIEIYRALNELDSRADTFAAQPQALAPLRDRITRTSPDIADEAPARLIHTLSNIDLNRQQKTFAESSFVEKGWEIALHTQDRLVLRWNSLELEFKEFESDGRVFFVAVNELSIEVFNAWMNSQQLWTTLETSLPADWRDFLNSRYDPMMDFRTGFRIWRPARNGLALGGIEITNAWFELDPFLHDDYRAVEQRLFPNAVISGQLPMVHLSPELARVVAEAMGMRLMHPEEWRLVAEAVDENDMHTWTSSQDQAFSAAMRRELRTGSFYQENNLQPADPVNATLSQWLSPVHSGSGELRHLAGNVAEVLYDADTRTYFVAGGSALMTPAAGWSEPIPVPANRIRTSYSDLGLRLAIDGVEPPAWIRFQTLLTAAWNNL